MDRKKIIVIISIIIIALLGGAYWYFSNKKPSATPSPQFPGESGLGAPSTGSEETPWGGDQFFTPGQGKPLPRLYELHKEPVAGVGFFETGKGTSHTLSARYIERGLGHIYETSLYTFVESRIVNETRSRISEALWGNGGKSVVIRFFDEKLGVIKTRIINIGSPLVSHAQSTSTQDFLDGFLKTEEVYLPDYIPFMATSEEGADKLFYLENSASSASGSTATFKSGASKIFASTFTEWLPQFPNQNLVTLTTRPSANIPGHMFFLDTKTKALTKVLGGINGLTTLTNHDGKFILYSETQNKLPELSLYDYEEKTSRPLYIQTIPEKCAWGMKEIKVLYCALPQKFAPMEYPDQWYQGLSSFSDELWRIDTEAGTIKKILTPSSLGAPALDIVNPVLSSDDQHLLFMNKVSGTPWVYSIVEPSQQNATPALSSSTTTKATVPESVVTSDMQKLK